MTKTLGGKFSSVAARCSGPRQDLTATSSLLKWCKQTFNKCIYVHCLYLRDNGGETAIRAYLLTLVSVLPESAS